MKIQKKKKERERSCYFTSPHLKKYIKEYNAWLMLIMFSGYFSLKGITDNPASWSRLPLVLQMTL